MPSSPRYQGRACLGPRPGACRCGAHPRGWRCQPLLGCPGPAQPGVLASLLEAALHAPCPGPSSSRNPFLIILQGPSSVSARSALALTDPSLVSGASHSPAALGGRPAGPLSLPCTHLQLAASYLSLLLYIAVKVTPPTRSLEMRPGCFSQQWLLQPKPLCL